MREHLVSIKLELQQVLIKKVMMNLTIWLTGWI